MRWPTRKIVEDVESGIQLGSIAPNVDDRLPEIETYNYKPLDATKREVRLLALHPGIASDEIRCDIKHKALGGGIFPPLAPDPRDKVIGQTLYETISYCWTGSHDTATIFVGDKKLTIPSSAARVLRKVRRRRRKRTLWIDAICIDQKNHAERNEQVALMTDIYRQSRQTLADLGDLDSSTADNAVKSIKVIVKDMNANIGPPMLLRNPRTRELGPKAGPLPIGVDFAALELFLTSSWFSRVWILQEAAVSKWTLCFVGNRTVDLMSVLDACVWMIRKQVYVPNSIMVSAGLSFGDQLWEYVHPWLGYYRDRDFDKGYSKFGGSSVLDALKLANQREASDPKDRVFGVLGLMHCNNRRAGHAQGLRPDYSKSLLSIYRDATLCHLREAYELAPLAHVYLRSTDEVEDADWPSWVPKWDRKWDEEQDAVPFASSGDRFDAALRPKSFEEPKGFRRTEKSSKQFWRDSVNMWKDTTVANMGPNPWLFCIPEPVPGTANLLSVPGIFADAVAICGPVLTAGKAKRYDTLCDWIEQARTMVELHVPVPTEAGIQNILRDTLIGGTVDHEEPLTIDQFTAYLLEQKRFPGHHSHEAESYSEAEKQASNFYDLFRKACENRCFVITSRGRMGLAPSVTRKGDVIAALHGGNVPYVLRPWEQNHKFLGDCYVHGIMYGEAMMEHKKRNRADTIFTLC